MNGRLPWNGQAAACAGLFAIERRENQLAHAIATVTGVGDIQAQRLPVLLGSQTRM